MKITVSNVIRLAVLQRLRFVYGIKLHKNKEVDGSNKTTDYQVRVFGVPLNKLQLSGVAEYGLVPCFLVDACQHLLKHGDTEGLFRKSSSVVRLKALRTKLDQGEACIATALPCDVASLVKQFFRELPKPMFPTDLQQALLKAQCLPTEEERTSATQLLSCLLSDTNSSTLRFFFNFLQKVSQRSSENKMNSFNLSVIFAPNFLHSCSVPEGGEVQHKLQVAAIHTLIENACTFGLVPEAIVKNGLAPHLLEEMDTDSGWKSRVSCSAGVLSSTTPGTPNSKWRPPSTAGPGDELSYKKWKYCRSFCLGMRPSVLFRSTPCSGQQDGSPSVVPERRVGSSARRTSCVSMCRRVKRAVSGCFSSSPQVSSLSQTPTPASYPDTPVGLTRKNNYFPELETAPSKTPVVSSIFKTLCCTSGAGCLDDRGSHKDGPSSPSSFSTESGQDLRLLPKSNRASSGQGVQLTTTSGLERGDAAGGGAAELAERRSNCYLTSQTGVKYSPAVPFSTMEMQRLSLRDADRAMAVLEPPIAQAKIDLQFQRRDLSDAVSSEGKHVDDGELLEAFDTRSPVTTNSNTSKEDPLLGTPLSTLCGTSSNQEADWVGLLEPRTPESKPGCTPGTSRPLRFRVADHVRKFNKLPFKSAASKLIGSPLRFQRTPVCQYVRRINSLLDKGPQTRTQRSSVSFRQAKRDF